MFSKRLSLFPSSRPSTSDDSHHSSEVVEKDDIPTLKRRHSLVNPIPESFFHHDVVDVNDISFDPFNHVGIRKSKSVAEGLTTPRKLYNGFDTILKRKSLKKSVRFDETCLKENFPPRTPVSDSGSEIEKGPIEASFDVGLGPFKEKDDNVPILTTVEISPLKSETSSHYSELSETNNNANFFTLEEYRTLGNLKQQLVTNLINFDLEMEQEEQRGLGAKRLFQDCSTFIESAARQDNEFDATDAIDQEVTLEEAQLSTTEYTMSKTDFETIINGFLSIIGTGGVVEIHNFGDYMVHATNKCVEMAAKRDCQIRKLEQEASEWKYKYQKELEGQIGMKHKNAKTEHSKEIESQLRRETFDLQIALDEISRTIAPFNLDNETTTGFIHNMIYKNKSLEFKEKDYQNNINNLEEELLCLKIELCNSEKALIQQAKEHTIELDSFKDQYYHKAKETVHLREDANRFSADKNAMQQYLKQTECNISKIESKYLAQTLEMVKLKKTINELRKCALSTSDEYREYRVKQENEAKQMEKLLMKEIKMQTKEMKKLIQDNLQYMELHTKFKTCNEKLLASNSSLINKYAVLVTNLLELVHTYYDGGMSEMTKQLTLLAQSPFEAEADFRVLDSMLTIIESCTKSLLIDFYTKERELTRVTVDRNKVNQQIIDKILITINPSASTARKRSKNRVIVA